MYNSPVVIYPGDVISKNFKDTIDDSIVMEIQREYGIAVDKDELIKALQYDRGQYSRGYRDGYDEARKDCTKTIGYILGELKEIIAAYDGGNGENNK